MQVRGFATPFYVPGIICQNKLKVRSKPHTSYTDAVEIKSAQTIAPDFFKGLRFFSKLSGDIRNRVVIYGGDSSYVREDFHVAGWRDIGKIL
jgi:hypothetical protein